MDDFYIFKFFICEGGLFDHRNFLVLLYDFIDCICIVLGRREVVALVEIVAGCQTAKLHRLHAAVGQAC